MRLNFTIRDCTDSNRPKVHDYVAMLRRILTQYPLRSLYSSLPPTASCPSTVNFYPI